MRLVFREANGDREIREGIEMTLLKIPRKVNYKKRLWKVFSEYVRRRDGGKCFTCDTVKDYKLMDAGHFIPAGTCPPPLYFDERNVSCQCTSCNRYKSGNLSVYAIRLVEKYGSEVLRELDAMKKRGGKWNSWTYQEYINLYKSKIESLAPVD